MNFAHKLWRVPGLLYFCRILNYFHSFKLRWKIPNKSSWNSYQWNPYKECQIEVWCNFKDSYIIIQHLCSCNVCRTFQTETMNISFFFLLINGHSEIGPDINITSFSTKGYLIMKQGLDIPLNRKTTALLKI